MTIRIDDWHAMEELFYGVHHCQVQSIVFETGLEGASTAKFIVLTRNRQAPSQLVPAFLIMLGAQLRMHFVRWDPSGRPETLTRLNEALGEAWRALRDEIELPDVSGGTSDVYARRIGRPRSPRPPRGLVEIHATDVARRFDRVAAILDKANRVGAGHGHTRSLRIRAGRIFVDGRQIEGRSFDVETGEPWLSGLSRHDLWNRETFAAATPSRFVLVEWATAA